MASRELGYRILWQARTAPQSGVGIKHLTVQYDSVFTLDGRNILTRLRERDGHRLWQLPVADALDEIQGITYMPQYERVFVTVGAKLLVLDADTGSQVAKQQLGQIANTAPVVLGPFLIYGARNGQVVWHFYNVGHQWRGYQIAPSINLKPALVGRVVTYVGSAPSVSIRSEKRRSEIARRGHRRQQRHDQGA